jgi:hypothetical protein
MITESLYQQAKSLLAEYEAAYARGEEPEYPQQAADIVKQYESGRVTHVS